MATSIIRLDKKLIARASKQAVAQNRTLSQQIEHWVKIAQIAEDNPDLPYEFIKQALTAKAERDSGKMLPYFPFRRDPQ
ncbi:MAG: hypothetical protein HUJ23_08745 [Methylophaga sp.]|nr:hypothetical protein [Methylophaga sp.]